MLLRIEHVLQWAAGRSQRHELLADRWIVDRWIVGHTAFRACHGMAVVIPVRRIITSNPAAYGDAERIGF